MMPETTVCFMRNANSAKSVVASPLPCDSSTVYVPPAELEMARRTWLQKLGDWLCK